MFNTGNKKDDERLKNLLIFHVYGTDEEVSEAAPIVVILVIVVAIIGGILFAFS
jgi:hypothetical protein